MATIRSVFSPGTTFNVLDPNAWVGGVVPGPNDIAQIGENGDYRATIHTDRAPYSTYTSPFSGSTIIKNQGSVIYPWEGNDVTIPVNSNAYNFNSEYQWPDTNGSFMIYPRGRFPTDVRLPIKIDYVSKSLDSAYYFYSCSVDRSFSNWIFKTGSNSEIYDCDFDEKGYPKEIYGPIRYNDYVYPLFTKFELTGSDTWHVGQIETLERCHLTIKDNATLKLDGSSVNPNAIYNNQDSYRNEIRILDNVTVELTGSTQRTNAGIYFYNRGGLFQISGSDLLPHTTLSQSANSGDSIITLTNTSSIGEGSIISIDNYKEPAKYIANTGYNVSMFSSGSNNINPYPYHTNRFSPTGSTIRQGTYGRGGATMFLSSSFREHEVVQVISQSGHEYTIAKLFGKEGTIQQDLGLFTYEQFVQNFSGSLAIPYEGQKRAVLIDSLHRDFQTGEKLIISRSTVAEVLYTDLYLSESLFLDFENGTTTDAIHTSSYAGYTGSFVDVTTNSQYNLYYEDYFRASQYWSTAPRTGSDGVTVTSSLHIGDFSNFYQPTNPQNYSACILKNTNFDEGEITIEWDRNRNLSGSADTSTYTSLLCGAGHKYDNVAPHYNSISSYQPYYMPLRQERDFTYLSLRQIDGGNTPFVRHFPFYGDRYARIGNKSVRFQAKVHIKNGLATSYLDGIKVGEQSEVSIKKHPIKLLTYRFSNIFNIRVKDYYQLVLLDTEESFDYKDGVLEGARLEYNQSSGKRVRASGNIIKDPLGYRNLIDDHVDNGKEATIKPALHSYTTTVAQDGNYNSFYRLFSNYYTGIELEYEHYYPRGYATAYMLNGSGFHIIYDLQSEVSMSALSFRMWYDYNYDYTTMASNPIQIDVSNDLESWTTVYGPTNDPRYTTRLAQLRFYDFVSGSTSARFVKLYMNGTSRYTNNRIQYLGLYNFYDENAQNMGNTVELYNADMFEVGDRVLFMEHKRPQGVEQRDQRYPAVEWDSLPGVTAGTTTDDDVCGGLTFLHTITAKDGNKITLDRKIANYPIYKGTHVYKWNQGSINFKGNHKNLAVWYNRRMQNDGMSMYQCVNANFDHTKTFSGLDGGGADNNPLNSITENISVNCIDKDSGAGFGGFVTKNVINAGGGYAPSAGGTTVNQNPGPDTYDALVFNCVFLGYSYYQHFMGVRMYNHYNNWVYTYNRTGGKYSNSNLSSVPNNKASFTIPKIKYAHNYIAHQRYGGIWSTVASGKLESTKGTIDHVEYRDNYSITAYDGIYSQANAQDTYGAYRNVIEHSNKIEMNKLYGYLSNTIPIPYQLWQNGGITTRLNGAWYPTKHPSVSPIMKVPMVSSGPSQNQPQYRIFKEENDDMYSIHQGFYYGKSQSRLWYAKPFIYYNSFKILNPHDVKIYTEFDYFREGWWLYRSSVNTTNDINRGYGDHVNTNIPKLVLFESLNKTIIDKVELSITGSNATVIYNKTHTLNPGEYIYGLYSDDLAGYGQKLFKHGSINHNIFSTQPSSVEIYYDNWDTPSLLENSPRTPEERDVASNKGRFKTLRASNTLPTGTIKIRKLKL